MADLPVFSDLFDAGEREALTRPSAFNPRIIRVDGSDVNIAVAVAAAMADEVAQWGQAEFGGAFLSTSAQQGREELDRFVFDRFQITRQEAQAAVVTLSFSRTGTAGFTIPEGFVVSADDGTTFETVNDLPFAANNPGPLSVVGVAQETGLGGNVAEGEITTLVSQTEDTTLAVTNTEDAAGGTPEEDQEELEARARDFFVNARRGTLSAIRAGLTGTPGVTQATVIEVLDPDGDPDFRVQGIIADANGQANIPLTQRAVDNLLEFRALGVPVIVTAGAPEFIRVIAEGLQFEANANTTTVLQDARSRVVAAVNALAPQQTLFQAILISALQATPQLIVPEGAVVFPAGDLVPASGTVIRTQTDGSGILLNTGLGVLVL